MNPGVTPLAIVHLLAPAEYGGLESVVATLARGQVDAGEDVTVVPLLASPAGGHPYIASLGATGARVEPLTVSNRGYLDERRAVGVLLRKLRPEVLHTHGYRPDVLDSPVARDMGIRTVSTVHGFTGDGLRGRAYEWLQRRAFRSFDAVVAVSRKLQGQLVASGVPADRVHAIQNAWRPLGDPASREEARAILGIPNSETVVGWVGRLSPEKGPDVMVEAMAEPASSGASVSLIGSGPMEGDLSALASALSIAERVRLHGAVPDAGRLLRAFDAVFLTSWTEGTPMILLEAMAAGVPIVTTSVGGVPDVVSPAEARLVPAGDASALSRAVAEVVRGDVGLYQRAAAASDRLARDFAVAPWVQRYRQIYVSSSRK